MTDHDELQRQASQLYTCCLTGGVEYYEAWEYVAAWGMPLWVQANTTVRGADLYYDSLLYPDTKVDVGTWFVNSGKKCLVYTAVHFKQLYVWEKRT